MGSIADIPSMYERLGQNIQLGGNYPYANSIYSVAALIVGAPTPVAGTVYRIFDRAGDKDSSGDLRVAFQVTAQLNGGAANETFNVFIITSADGTNWQKCAEMPVTLSTVAGVLRFNDIVYPTHILEYVGVLVESGGAGAGTLACDVQVCTNQSLVLQTPAGIAIVAATAAVDVTPASPTTIAPVAVQYGSDNMPIGATSVTVALHVPFADAGYSVIAQGTDAQGNTDTWIEDKIAASFDVHVAAAPVGAVMNFNWIAVRAQ